MIKDIKTSYFANWRKWPKGYEPIGITNRPPPYWGGWNLSELGPSSYLLYQWKHGIITEQGYKDFYLAELNAKFTPEQVLDMLPDKCILLCYEGPNRFCHRHLLVEWLGYGECEI